MTLIGHYTNFWPLLIWTWLPNLNFYLIVQGFHRTHATGAANRGRLLLRTPGPIPFGICKCSFVETTNTQLYITLPIHDPFSELTSYRTWLLSLNWHHHLMTFYLIWLLTEFDITEYRFPLGICSGCGMLTGDAYSSGHLVLSHFGTCMCSNVETNLSSTCLVSGRLNFEHPSVLLFCSVTWPYTMTTPYWSDLIPNSTFYRILSGFHITFATVGHANRGCVLLRTPGPVPLGLAYVLLDIESILFRICRYFSGLCSSNIPRYFLDFASYFSYYTFG